MPSPGRITALRTPDGPGIRADSGVEAGDEVPVYYDALISKLVASGADRPQAVARMRRALAEYDVRGIRTTVPFFRWLLEQPVFLDAAFHTGFLDTLLQQRRGTSFSAPESSLREVALVAAAIYTSLADVSLSGAGHATPSRRRDGGPGVRPALPNAAWTQQARVESLRE